MVQTDIDEFIRRLEKIESDPLMRESDRGCVLVRTADLERQLQSLLAHWFVVVGGIARKEEERMFDFNGPAGTLSAKIMLARSMGLIDKELYGDLQRLRGLRNLAAHTSADFSLSSKEARAFVSGMNHEYGKSGTIRRYSMRSSGENSGSEAAPEPSDAVMKGFGFVRYDKSNFIVTTSIIGFHLTRAAVESSVMASAMVHSRILVRDALRADDASAPDETK